VGQYRIGRNVVGVEVGQLEVAAWFASEKAHFGVGMS
jgi:hypothetical protein